MLAPADAKLVGRDPAVAGLALVLDDDALADRVDAARPDLGVRSVRGRYVRYKPGTSCLVGLRLETPEGEVDAFVKAYRRGDGAKVAKARDKSGTALSLGQLVVLAPVAGDRDLPAAPRLASAGRRRRLLRQLLPGAPATWDDLPRCLRYKPERRWVGTVEHEGEPLALVKAYRSADLARARRGLRFAHQAGLEAPRLLGESAAAAALASSWVRGETLSDLLARPGGGGGATTLRAAGEALAGLHQASPGGLPAPSAAEDADALEAAAAHLGVIAPRLGSCAAALARSLRPRLVAGTGVMETARHGDFSADQVVRSRRGVVLVDFDQVEVGDPQGDLGHFIAALWATHLASPLPAGPPPASSIAPFLAGYEAAGGMVATERTADHAAAALVRLAVEPFRTRAADWPLRTEAILGQAVTFASSASPS